MVLLLDCVKARMKVGDTGAERKCSRIRRLEKSQPGHFGIYILFATQMGT